jgi:hypothetical protein
MQWPGFADFAHPVRCALTHLETGGIGPVS